MSLNIQVEENTIFKKLDFSLIIIILLLNIIGLIIVFSATHGPLSKDVAPLFISQIFWLIIGWGVFFVTTIFDYGVIGRVSYFIYILNFAAVILIKFVGSSALGARRWLDLGFFRYQPSETMKLALILVMAKILSSQNHRESGLGFREVLLPIIILIAPSVFIAKQPDLGTALLLLAIGGSMLLFVKVKRIVIVTGFIAAVSGSYVYWNFQMKDFQKNRISTFIDPTLDPQGSGYNSIQSKIAVGSGLIIGKGFKNGTQSQLEFLPERHTDFIFSVLSEEFGFVGSVLVICTFMYLFVIGISIANHARDRFGALIVVGVLGYIFWHMFINIGMVIGLLPIVGVPLPLLSYGGSSMLTTMAGLGLVSSVAYRRYLF